MIGVANHGEVAAQPYTRRHQGRHRAGLRNQKARYALTNHCATAPIFGLRLRGNHYRLEAGGGGNRTGDGLRKNKRTIPRGCGPVQAVEIVRRVISRPLREHVYPGPAAVV